MSRTWWVLLLLFAGALFGQDGDDEDDGIVDDSAPVEESDEPEPSAKPGARPSNEPAPAREKGKKPGWVEHTSKDEKHRIKLPDDWVVRNNAGADGRVLFDCDVRLPGSKARASLVIVHEKEMGDARIAPLRYRANALKDLKASTSEVGVKPLPWLLVPYERDGRDVRSFYTFQNRAGRGYFVRLQCLAADFKQARKDLLTASKHLATDLPLYPEIPKHYKRARAGRFTLALHPSMKSSLTPMKKLLKTQEKAFAKFHGKLPKASADRPAVIYVHASKMHAEKVHKPAAEADGDFTTDTRHRRLFAVPIPKKAKEKAGLFVGEVQGLLFLEKYGSVEPLWAFVGERMLARAAYATTKRLPYLHAGMAAWGDSLIMEPLDKVPAMDRKNFQPFAHQGFFWVCMLQGTKRKKAYKAMLADLARHYDPARAMAPLLALDQQELKTEAQRYKDVKIKRFRPKEK